MAICRCPKGCSQVCKLTFKSDESPERQKLNRVMWNRAWILNSVILVWRIYRSVRQTSWWDTWAIDKDKASVVYETGIVDEIIPWGSLIHKCLLGVSFILTILCFKWRFLARGFFHLELIQAGMLYMIPLNTCIGEDTIQKRTLDMMMLD